MKRSSGRMGSGKKMKQQNRITVVAAFLSALLLAGPACAQKNDAAANPDTASAETTAITEILSSPVESETVVETELKSENTTVVAKAIVVEAVAVKQEETIEVAAKPEKADDAKKGKTIQLEQFSQQTGLSFKFNRLLRRKLSKNLPPVEDGIHDPKNAASILLQTPKDGMKGFVKSRFGNRVDWVKTLNQKIINPRASLEDPTEEMEIMELNVVRVPVGSMPKVVYPHDRHTAWLACENCHEEIFLPEAGANDISMEMIIRGEKCGVCHGKVAFPISQCKKCHSLRKTKEEKASQGIK